jgi:hypothetical protein
VVVASFDLYFSAGYILFDLTIGWATPLSSTRFPFLSFFDFPQECVKYFPCRSICVCVASYTQKKNSWNEKIPSSRLSQRVKDG